MTITYEDIEKEYVRIARVWNSKTDSMYIEKTRPDEGEYLEIAEDGKVSLMYTERGIAKCLFETYSLDDLMYRIFADRAKAYARGYILKHQNTREDPRRIGFQLALERIAMISSEWRGRLQEEINEILGCAPYNDHAYRSTSTEENGKP